jgi:hypothetical protein
MLKELFARPDVHGRDEHAPEGAPE